MTLMGGRTSEQWIAQYATSHHHPVNRFCHTLGIPLIVISIGWFAIAWITSGSMLFPVTLFLIGWALQFIGHAFEGKRPEFPRLAISVCRPALVGRESPRPSLNVSHKRAVSNGPNGPNDPNDPND